MSESIKLKKGYDIPVQGAAEKLLSGDVNPLKFAVKPVDFPGLIPKLNVKPGGRVKAGSPLFYNKLNPEILFTSPVSGTVLSVERGDRRKILEVIVGKGGNDSISFSKADPLSLSREEVTKALLQSGLWPAIRQRPYNIIAKPYDNPKAIFISGFDTAPLAPDLNFVIDNSPAGLFQTGINALTKLTGGKIHLVLNGKADSSQVLKGTAGVEISYFSGPHPVGNV